MLTITQRISEIGLCLIEQFEKETSIRIEELKKQREHLEWESKLE